MKAHVAPAPRVILTWNVPEESPAGQVLAARAAAFGLEIRPVYSQHAGCTVEWLCGYAGASPVSLLLYVPQDSFRPAAVFSGLTDAELDSTLAALRAAGASIPFKAVVTRHNRAWPFCHLMAELEKEHIAFSTTRPPQQ